MAQNPTLDAYWANRFVPAADSEDLFGEVRSLSYHRFEGNERWEEWQQLFLKMTPELRAEAIGYVAKAWEIPDASKPTLFQVERAFQRKVLGALFPFLRAHNPSIDLDFLPPADEEDVAAWEEERGVQIPENLRFFLTQCSSGVEFDSEEAHIWFERETEWSFRGLAYMAYEALENPEYGADSYDDIRTYEFPGGDVTELRRNCVFNALSTLLEKQPVGEWLEVTPLYLVPPSAADRIQVSAEETIILYHDYFEQGGAAETITFVLTAGPYQGFVITWSGYIHSGGFGGRLKLEAKEVTGWLIARLKRWE